MHMVVELRSRFSETIEESSIKKPACSKIKKIFAIKWIDEAIDLSLFKKPACCNINKNVAKKWIIRINELQR